MIRCVGYITCIRQQKSNSTLLKSGNYVLYDMFEGIYYTRVPSWNRSLVIFAIFCEEWPKEFAGILRTKSDKIRCNVATLKVRSTFYLLQSFIAFFHTLFNT